MNKHKHVIFLQIYLLMEPETSPTKDSSLYPQKSWVSRGWNEQLFWKKSVGERYLINQNITVKSYFSNSTDIGKHCKKEWILIRESMEG